MAYQDYIAKLTNTGASKAMIEAQKVTNSQLEKLVDALSKTNTQNEEIQKYLEEQVKVIKALVKQRDTDKINEQVNALNREMDSLRKTEKFSWQPLPNVRQNVIDELTEAHVKESLSDYRERLKREKEEEEKKRKNQKFLKDLSNTSIGKEVKTSNNYLFDSMFPVMSEMTRKLTEVFGVFREYRKPKGKSDDEKLADYEKFVREALREQLINKVGVFEGIDEKVKERSEEMGKVADQELPKIKKEVEDIKEFVENVDATEESEELKDYLSQIQDDVTLIKEAILRQLLVALTGLTDSQEETRQKLLEGLKALPQASDTKLLPQGDTNLLPPAEPGLLPVGQDQQTAFPIATDTLTEADFTVPKAEDNVQFSWNLPGAERVNKLLKKKEIEDADYEMVDEIASQLNSVKEDSKEEAKEKEEKKEAKEQKNILKSILDESKKQSKKLGSNWWLLLLIPALAGLLLSDKFREFLGGAFEKGVDKVGAKVSGNTEAEKFAKDKVEKVQSEVRGEGSGLPANMMYQVDDDGKVTIVKAADNLRNRNATPLGMSGELEAYEKQILPMYDLSTEEGREDYDRATDKNRADVRAVTNFIEGQAYNKRTFDILSQGNDKSWWGQTKYKTKMFWHGIRTMTGDLFHKDTKASLEAQKLIDVISVDGKTIRQNKNAIGKRVNDLVKEGKLVVAYDKKGNPFIMTADEVKGATTSEGKTADALMAEQNQRQQSAINTPGQINSLGVYVRQNGSWLDPALLPEDEKKRKFFIEDWNFRARAADLESVEKGLDEISDQTVLSWVGSDYHEKDGKLPWKVNKDGVVEYTGNFGNYEASKAEAKAYPNDMVYGKDHIDTDSIQRPDYDKDWLGEPEDLGNGKYRHHYKTARWRQDSVQLLSRTGMGQGQKFFYGLDVDARTLAKGQNVVQPGAPGKYRADANPAVHESIAQYAKVATNALVQPIKLPEVQKPASKSEEKSEPTKNSSNNVVNISVNNYSDNTNTSGVKFGD